MRYLSKGKRGIVYISRIKGKETVVKVKNPESKAIDTLEKEAKWLRKLNKFNIGPKLISFSDNKLVMEYIEGENFVDYFRGKNDKKVVLDILKQCHKLDKLKINKYEMHNPVKHIIIRNKKPVLIDFERCRFDEHPKNVTQFCQFLVKIGVNVDRKEMIDLMKKYKKDYSKKAFDEICRLFLKFINR